MGLPLILGGIGALSALGFLGKDTVEAFGFDPLGRRRRTRKGLEAEFEGGVLEQAGLNLDEGFASILDELTGTELDFGTAGLSNMGKGALEAELMRDLSSTEAGKLASIAETLEYSRPSFAETMMKLGLG